MGKLLERITDRHAIALGLLSAVLNVFFILTEQFWGLLLPFALLIVLLVFFALDKVLLFIIFSAPLSIFFFDEQLHVGFTLPTEPLIFGVMLVFFFKLIYRGGFDHRVALHPLSIAILLNVFWMLVSSITSEIPLVSFKYTLARIWFIAVFFYLGSQLFRNKNRIYNALWLYMIPLTGVVIRTIIEHAHWDFTKEASVWVMSPFYKEHTVYGAALALFIPVAIALGFVVRDKLNKKILGGAIALILLVGVVLSYTRAAWVSLVLSGIAGLLIWLRIGRGGVFVILLASIGFLYWAKDDLIERFQKNTATSSDNFTEHVESISNISTDASNMERINRWKSALRMFQERPHTGFGPGTYMFLYAPFQKPHEKTVISTNAGDQGNAHSEYIGPLAESGWPGLLSVLLIVYFTVTTGIRAYYRSQDFNTRVLSMALLMGLITYWVHGLLNNFLDMDKTAIPVWFFTAALVVIDRYHSGESESISKGDAQESPKLP